MGVREELPDDCESTAVVVEGNSQFGVSSGQMKKTGRPGGGIRKEVDMSIGRSGVQQRKRWQRKRLIVNCM